MSDERNPQRGKPPPPDVGLEDDDPLASAREETIEVLSECFARDMLTIEDLERRAELAHGARTMTDLAAAIDGIETGGALASARTESVAGAVTEGRARPSRGAHPAQRSGDCGLR